MRLHGSLCPGCQRYLGGEEKERCMPPGGLVFVWRSQSASATGSAGTVFSLVHNPAASHNALLAPIFNMLSVTCMCPRRAVLKAKDSRRTSLLVGMTVSASQPLCLCVCGFFVWGWLFRFHVRRHHRPAGEHRLWRRGRRARHPHH